MQLWLPLFTKENTWLCIDFLACTEKVTMCNSNLCFVNRRRNSGVKPLLRSFASLTLCWSYWKCVKQFCYRASWWGALHLLQCMYFVFLSFLLLVFKWCTCNCWIVWGGGISQWWEHSPHISVVWVSLPDPHHVGLLLFRFFFHVLRFSPLL